MTALMSGSSTGDPRSTKSRIKSFLRSCQAASSGASNRRPRCKGERRAQPRPSDRQTEHPVKIVAEPLAVPARGKHGAGGRAVVEADHADRRQPPRQRVVAIPREQRDAGLRGEGIPLAFTAGGLGVEAKRRRGLFKHRRKLATAPRDTLGIGGEPVMVQNDQQGDAAAEDIFGVNDGVAIDRDECGTGFHVLQVCPKPSEFFLRKRLSGVEPVTAPLR